MSKDREEMRFEKAVVDVLKPILELKDPTITDIIINSNDTAFVYYADGRREEHKELLMSADDIDFLSGMLAYSLQTDASAKSPVVSASWGDPPMRIEILLSPIVKSPCLTFRKTRGASASLSDLLAAKMMTKEQFDTLRGYVLSRKNIIISGETGSGKTTLANALLNEIPEDERLFIIEDTPELRAKVRNKVEVTTSTFFPAQTAVREALRSMPDRIIVGEVRDGAALDLLKAWNTGHSGGIGTIHANSASSVKLRLSTLILEVSASPLDRLIDEAVDVIIQVAITRKGRRITEILDFTEKGNTNG